MSLPLASTLHSYVPIIVFNLVFYGYEQKYKNNYHNLPQNTTLLISFTTSFFFLMKNLVKSIGLNFKK